MTNKNVRKEDMLIGNHFGKRKPQWNFFIKKYESFKYSMSLQLVKMVAMGLAVQGVILSPVIYWIYQNYSIIEKNLPAHFNLQDNIQFEKKWIAFLILGSLAAQGTWNFLIWKKFITSEPYSLKRSSEIEPQRAQLASVKSASPVEVDYPRRAS
ncbi:MAG: hypothetical protein H7061_02835 [Bdellovibrionaceae bacterium]|nr:hypothetical protein [Bdellovibrio sp.]